MAVTHKDGPLSNRTLEEKLAEAKKEASQKIKELFKEMARKHFKGSVPRIRYIKARYDATGKHVDSEMAERGGLACAFFNRQGNLFQLMKDKLELDEESVGYFLVLFPDGVLSGLYLFKAGVEIGHDWYAPVWGTAKEANSDAYLFFAEKILKIIQNPLLTPRFWR